MGCYGKPAFFNIFVTRPKLQSKNKQKYMPCEQKKCKQKTHTGFRPKTAQFHSLGLATWHGFWVQNFVCTARASLFVALFFCSHGPNFDRKTCTFRVVSVLKILEFWSKFVQ